MKEKTGVVSALLVLAVIVLMTARAPLAPPPARYRLQAPPQLKNKKLMMRHLQQIFHLDSHTYMNLE